MSVNFALIGTGRIGSVHAANITAANHATLTVVHDTDTAAATAIAAATDATVAPTADAAITAAGVDAVLIASPTATHVDYIATAAAAGKAVLCEKPIALDLAAVDACRDAIGDAVVQVGFNRRFDPGHAELARRIAAGDIGRLEQLSLVSRDPALPSMDYLRASGGIFRDMMIHDFDLARHILAAAGAGEPATVTATASAIIAPELAAIGDHDTAMVTLATADGVQVHIANARRAVYGYDQRIEAHGAGGMLTSGNRTRTGVTASTATATDAAEPLLHFFTERYADAYRLQLAEFIRAVNEKRAPSPSFEDGRRALIVALAAMRALKEQRAIAIVYN